MNKIPIVFPFSNEFILPGWISISSLIISAKKNTKYLIYIIHEDLEKNHIKNISKLVENKIHSLNFINISKKLKELDYFNNLNHCSNSRKKELSSKSCSKIQLSKLFVTEILPAYEKIIVSDIDVLFKKDLYNIFNKNLSKYHYGLVAAENISQNITAYKRYDFYKNKYIYFSKFIIYNTKKMTKDNIFEKFRLAIIDLKEKLNNKITDLVLLNMCSKNIYKIPLKYLVSESILLKKNMKDTPDYHWFSQLYSYMELEEVKKDPSIIHYNSFNKPSKKPWERFNPPEDYKKFIYLSPYKHEWIANKYLKRIIKKNPLFFKFSKTKIYKVFFKKLFKSISILITSIFGPIFWKYFHYKKRKNRNIMIHHEYGKLSNEEIFSKIYENNIWNKNSKNDFNSGPGSHDADIIKPYINEICSFLKINTNLTVLDIGCGDFNIGSHIFHNSKKYIAIDIVDKLIDRNKKKFNSNKLIFKKIDIVNEDIPKGDCLLIKEVLQHLPNNQIKIILSKLKNYKYIFLTESIPLFNFKPNMDKIKGPDCRIDINSAIVIDKPPFNFKYKSKKELLRIKKEDRYIVTTFYEN